MKNIKIIDVSLREIQNSDLTLSFKEKLEIAKKLDELGVDVIEFGGSLEKADEVLVKTVSTCLTKSTLGLVIDGKVKDIEKCFSLISSAKNKKLIIKMPVSPINMEYSFHIKPAVILKNFEELTKKAVSICDNVEVYFDDATRAENEFLISAIKTILACGVKSITISDQAGVMEADEFKTFIENIIAIVPEIKNVDLFVECSDEFRIATSSILNVLPYISGVKLSALNNYNLPDYEHFFSALSCIGEKKGYSSKINKTCVSRVINQISSISLGNKQVIASNDIPTENISKTITLSSLNKLLKKRGYDLMGEDVAKIYDEIIRIGEKKDLTTKELDSIVAVTALQVPATFELKNYAVHSSNVLASTANVTLIKNKDTEINGIAFGNGSVDSAFLAIENALGRHFDLDEFSLNSVTEGKEAMGETIIKLRNNGKIYSGRGVSTDIVGASIRAYINALNKIVYEEKE